MRGWQPNAADKEALRTAAASVTWAGSLWHDDVLQAGLIALWRLDSEDIALKVHAARYAMIDEARRLRGTRNAARSAAEFVDLDGATSALDLAVPEAHCAVRQAIASIQAKPRVSAFVESILRHDSKGQVAREYGVSNHRVTQRLRDVRAVLSASI